MAVLEEKQQSERDFVQSPEIKELIIRSLSYIKAGYPVHFTGPSGVGKTSLALRVAKKRKRPVMLIHGNSELSNEDLIGAFTGYQSTKTVDHFIRSVYKKDETVTEKWKNGRLLEAVKNGYTLIYDEFTRSHPSTNNLFLSILEEKILPLYGTKHTEPFVRVHPKFSVIFTSNPSEYAGVYKTQDALLDRLITIPITHLDKEQEASILTNKTDLNSENADKIAGMVASLREKCSKKVDSSGPSLRASLMIAQLAEEADLQIDGSDEQFQQLCMDILWFPVSKSLEETDQEKVKSMILSECKKIKKE